MCYYCQPGILTREYRGAVRKLMRGRPELYCFALAVSAEFQVPISVIRFQAHRLSHEPTGDNFAQWAAYIDYPRSFSLSRRCSIGDFAPRKKHGLEAWQAIKLWKLVAGFVAQRCPLLQTSQLPQHVQRELVGARYQPQQNLGSTKQPVPLSSQPQLVRDQFLAAMHSIAMCKRGLQRYEAKATIIELLRAEPDPRLHKEPFDLSRAEAHFDEEDQQFELRQIAQLRPDSTPGEKVCQLARLSVDGRSSSVKLLASKLVYRCLPSRSRRTRQLKIRTLAAFSASHYSPRECMSSLLSVPLFQDMLERMVKHPSPIKNPSEHDIEDARSETYRLMLRKFHNKAFANGFDLSRPNNAVAYLKSALKNIVNDAYTDYVTPRRHMRSQLPLLGGFSTSYDTDIERTERSFLIAAAETPSAHDELARKELWQIMERLLTPFQFEIIRLWTLHDLSQREIAERLVGDRRFSEEFKKRKGRPVSVVRRQFDVAIEMLQASLKSI